jgi:hypothetical protein
MAINKKVKKGFLILFGLVSVLSLGLSFYAVDKKHSKLEREISEGKLTSTEFRSRLIPLIDRLNHYDGKITYQEDNLFKRKMGIQDSSIFYVPTYEDSVRAYKEIY